MSIAISPHTVVPPRFNPLRRRLLLLALTCASCLPGYTQEPAPAQDSAQESAPAISTTELESRLAATQESTALDDAAKARITELYTQALEQLRIAEQWRAKANQFEEMRNNAPDLIRAIQEELAQPPATTPSSAETEAEWTLSEMEARVAEAESTLTAVQTELADLEKESAQRADRRRQIPELQAGARQRLEAIRNQLSAPPPESESAELLEAQRLHNEARREAAEQELRSYEQELLSYDARGRLLSLRTDRARRQVEQARREAEVRRVELSQFREQEARATVRAERWRELTVTLAENEAPQSIQEIAQGLIEDITGRSRERAAQGGMLDKIAAAERMVKERDEAFRQLENTASTLRKKVDAATSSSVIGALLRSHRSGLDDVREIEQRIGNRQHEISEIQIEQISVEEERREFYNIGALVREAMEDAGEGLSEESRETIADVLRELYTAKRDVLDAVVEDYESYFESLLDLDAREQQLIAAKKEFRNYINERVLWVRSGNAIHPSDMHDILQAFHWLFSRENIAAFAHAVFSDLARSPIQVSASLLAVLALIASRWQMRRRIQANAEEAQKRSCMSIRPTVDAAIYTLLVSAGVPLLIALIGWRAAASLAGTDYTNHVGTALAGCAFYVWSLEFWREIMRPHGLGIAHFGWSDTPCRSVARQVFVFEMFTIPLLLLVAVFDAHGSLAWQSALGRLALIIALLGLTVLGHRFMRYRNGAVLDVIERARKRSNLTWRRVWYFLAVLAPIALATAAAAGYYYSAMQISGQIHTTLTCFLALVVFFQIVMRSTVMTRRRLARKRAKSKLQAMRGSVSDLDAPNPHEEVDLDRIDTQAMRLIRSAFVISLAACVWFIWSNDLPALSVLDKQQLWQVTETIETETRDAADNIVYETGIERSWITLRDVAVFLFILGITFIAVQNLPGLLEIVLLQRLSLIAGERYAINTIVGYIIAILGMTWALNAIGFGWGRLQWLIAAVGLGLGFGLQEIFANLVSGIIILFERPIRVGDTVTVGEISGTVSKIRIRATWITAFNRQELIVPNKEFVTGRLVNWTLSDQVLRIEIPVGIAYGSDVELARRLMLEVAKAHPLVLEDPEPSVYFMGFGDSSLNFEMRVHSPDLESFLDIKDAMHTGIDKAFRAHGVEIPFPQRDLHVRTIQEGLRIEQTPPGKDSI